MTLIRSVIAICLACCLGLFPAVAETPEGVWTVVHTNVNGESVLGRAQVARDGSLVQLDLQASSGGRHYRSVEFDADVFELGTGPFEGAILARFEEVADPVLDNDGVTERPAKPFPLPSTQETLAFEKDDINLDLAIVWDDTNRPRIRVAMAADPGESYYQGVWYEEKDDDLIDGGLATWIRGQPEIKGVVAVDQQLDPSAGMNYPFRPDGSKIPQVSTRRTLVVYGHHLPQMSDRAAIRSASDNVSYSPDFRMAGDRATIIAKALERAKIENADQYDALIVHADLSAGVLPGTKIMTVNGAVGAWPLMFANQSAKIVFTRGSGDPVETFFEGDFGYVELVFEEDPPQDEIAVRVAVGDKPSGQVAVIKARKFQDESLLHTVFRTDQIRFLPGEPEPEDAAASSDPVTLRASAGDVVRAALLDPAEAYLVPPVTQARVERGPDQMGELWKSALKRVAACKPETIESFDAYQNKPAETVSNLIIHELGRRSIELKNGDHAAALLIRDEFVSQMRALMAKFEAELADPATMRAARRQAAAYPAISNSRFWRDSLVEYESWRFAFWSVSTEYTLAETLDVRAISEEQSVSVARATEWAESETLKAGAAQLARMKAAIVTAEAGGDCDLGAALVIAGHRADPVVNKIVSQLFVQEESKTPGEPPVWVPDQTARGYVKSLYVAGAAIRAMEEYSSTETDVAMAAAAVVGGAAAALMEVTGYGVAAFWLSLTDAAVGVGMGGVGVYEYYQGESLYEMARGASPVLGEDILHAAIRNRKSELMTVLGVLLPMASGSANIYAFRQSDLHNLRYLKNIRRGEDIVRRNGAVLENLNDLTRAERINVTSYYTDLLRRSETPGLGALSATHAEDLARFNAHFERLGISSPTLREVPAPAPVTDPPPSSASSTPEPPSAPPPAPFDPDATVVVDPNTTDPNMMATTIGPAVPQPAVTLYDFPRVQTPNPNAAADIFEQVPGARLLERGIDEGQIQRIIERSRLGEEVTADDMLDRIDAMRVQRLNSQSPPLPEPE